MSTYAYLCLDTRGAEIRGQMDAPDENAARRQLREQGLKILDLAEGFAGGGGLMEALRAGAHAISRQRSVRNSDRVLFYHQMALMLGAGHTLVEALSAAARLAPRARMADILGRIASGIQRGNSLSVACAGEKELFSRLALKLIEAGEASGELGTVFERLAAMIERRAEVRRQLATAMFYPGVVFVFACGVITLLVTAVIPKFAMFLAGRGKSIPWTAQTVMDIADWLDQWGLLIFALIAGVAVAIPLARRLPPARLVIDRSALFFPVLGQTIVVAAMAQAMWVFGMLIKSRLTVLESLRICAQVAGNSAYASAFAKAADEVLVGKSLAVALDHPVLPALVQHMAAIGEKSGQIDTVMESLGVHYQKALDARVKLLAAMVEPTVILVVGGIVGLVYLAFFQAMFSMSSG